MAHHKLLQLLEVLMYLSNGLARSVHDISERFDMSERTVFRYIRTFKDAGFIIQKSKNGHYCVDKDSPYFRDISELLHFSREEAEILREAIHRVNNENTLKQNLIKKLYALYDFDRVAETIVNERDSVVVHELTKAIKRKQPVVLKEYLSANSKTCSDRCVEPFDFTTNYVSVWAFDCEDQRNKTFKISRINSVDLLSQPLKYASAHQCSPIDVFRISGDEKFPVKLKLSIRAYELLVEEYPLSEAYVTDLGDHTFLFETSVMSYEGVGRFILGLINEVEVIAPKELRMYIKNKIKRYTDTI